MTNCHHSENGGGGEKPCLVLLFLAIIYGNPLSSSRIRNQEADFITVNLAQQLYFGSCFRVVSRSVVVDK